MSIAVALAGAFRRAPTLTKVLLWLALALLVGALALGSGSGRFQASGFRKTMFIRGPKQHFGAAQVLLRRQADSDSTWYPTFAGVHQFPIHQGQRH
jgi:hypothetical protein